MHSSAKRTGRAALAAAVTAAAAAALTGCTWIGGTPSAAPTTAGAANATTAAGASTGSAAGKTATKSSKPGVPSEPAYLSKPEPSTVATDPKPTSTPAPGATVPVLITYSGYDAGAQAVQLGGNVTGVIESNGTCTVTLTLAGRTVTASAPAQPDASTTDCTGLSVPRAQLSSGTWQAVLTYRSAAHTGTSAPVGVAVP